MLLNSLENNEKAVTLQLKIMAIYGDLQKTLGVRQIERYKFEHHVGCGRIDLYLIHTDGGVTLVEAKAENKLTTMAAGIGQLLVYEAALRIKQKKNKYPKYIDKILCVPVDIEKHPELEIACFNSGIKLVSLMTFGKLQKLINKLVEKINNG